MVRNPFNFRLVIGEVLVLPRILLLVLSRTMLLFVPLWKPSGITDKSKGKSTGLNCLSVRCTAGPTLTYCDSGCSTQPDSTQPAGELLFWGKPILKLHINVALWKSGTGYVNCLGRYGVDWRRTK